ncbi:MAG: leucine-rich repeat protein, partial [Eubacterium sp.]|nr:leucine-rich repeat protein [Eubacterium sp.]
MIKFLKIYRGALLAHLLCLALILGVAGILPGQEPRNASAETGDIKTVSNLTPGDKVRFVGTTGTLNTTWTYCGQGAFECDNHIGTYTSEQSIGALAGHASELSSELLGYLAKDPFSGGPPRYWSLIYDARLVSPVAIESFAKDGATTDVDTFLALRPCGVTNSYLYTLPATPNYGYGDYTSLYTQGGGYAYGLTYPAREALTCSCTQWYWFTTDDLKYHYYSVYRTASGGFEKNTNGKKVATYPAVVVRSDRRDAMKFEEQADGTYRMLAKGAIRYQANGGSGSQANGSYYIGENVPESLTATTTFLPPDGKCFAGWGETPDATEPVTSIVPPEADSVNVYAIWRDKYVTVNYDPDGATGTLASESVIGSAATSLADGAKTRAALRKKGYAFRGWSATPDGTALAGNTYDAYGLREGEEFTVYALWEPAATYETIDGKKVLTRMAIDSGDDPYIEPDTEVIAAGAFDDCIELKNVTIPYGVTKVERGAFLNMAADATSLVDIFVKNPDCEIELESFKPRATKLVSLVGSTADRLAASTPDLFFRGITTVEKGYFDGEVVKKFICPEGVTTLGSADDSTGVLEGHLELTEFDPGHVKVIGARAIRDCVNVTGVLTIPSTVETIGENAFEHIGYEKIILKSAHIDPSTLVATGLDRESMVVEDQADRSSSGSGSGAGSGAGSGSGSGGGSGSGSGSGGSGSGSGSGGSNGGSGSSGGSGYSGGSGSSGSGSRSGGSGYSGGSGSSGGSYSGGGSSGSGSGSGSSTGSSSESSGSGSGSSSGSSSSGSSGNGSGGESTSGEGSPSTGATPTPSPTPLATLTPTTPGSDSSAGTGDGTSGTGSGPNDGSNTGTGTGETGNT